MWNTLAALLIPSAVNDDQKAGDESDELLEDDDRSVRRAHENVYGDQTARGYDMSGKLDSASSVRSSGKSTSGYAILNEFAFLKQEMQEFLFSNALSPNHLFNYVTYLHFLLI